MHTDNRKYHSVSRKTISQNEGFEVKKDLFSHRTSESKEMENFQLAMLETKLLNPQVSRLRLLGFENAQITFAPHSVSLKKIMSSQAPTFEHSSNESIPFS